MRIVWIAALLFSIAVLSGCVSDNPNNGPEETSTPEECLPFEGQHCELFECLVESCWCDETGPDGPVLQEGNSIVSSEQDAIAVVLQYVQNEKQDYNEVNNAVQLNNSFWNVFAYNSENDEMVFTVQKDGTIIKTVCGV